MIKIASTLIIAIYILTIAFMRQQTKDAVIKVKEEERLACENMIASANLNNQTKTTKTIIKYEKIKSNVSTYDINERSRLLQQIEDFNFAD
jgi:TATA-box binding protein (TBP) (component of TFIID and TFIIIB)